MSRSLYPRALLGVCCLATAPSLAAQNERSCHVDGVETPVTCVTLDVRRDYDRPDGATLAITAVIVLASTGRPASDALLLLAGRPGQSATSLGGPVGVLITQARHERDVILFDVRGTGLSEPLHCDLVGSLWLIVGGADFVTQFRVLNRNRALAAALAVKPTATMAPSLSPG